MIPTRITLKGVKLGLIEAGGVHVEPSPAGLAGELESSATRAGRRLTVEAVAAMETVGAVWSMFRAWGLDPSKYRPSSEALLRRVAQGKGLTPISNVVDIVNLAQIETGWPMGGYDLGRIHPPVTLRLGEADEKYEGIGRRVWHLAGRPVLADEAGPFGSPISDSTRTMVSNETRALWVVIFAPGTSADAAIDRTLARLEERLGQWAAGQNIRRNISPPAAGESV
ncbi:MAG TPA: phenylalanine--tRNA ligase beta subunit-related protein [Patescibacteria group bacterium]|nr:phenylalanine--tRNA ligase beta subunit-related protein [Patescibacteria group bacterium]